MALTSPGVSISVIDQSINQGAGPGTVPLVVIATQSNKADPTSSGSIAPGTLPANAGKVYSITSQRELSQTFGDPVFYNVSGTALNGYPLNEYGLLATYSYLGIANLARVVRADIDMAQLQATPVAPTSPAAIGTLWLDESSNGTTYGLFTRTGTFPNEVWVPVVPKYVFNYATGTSQVPSSSVGAVNDVAVQFKTANGHLEYYVKLSGGWSLLGSVSGTDVIVQSVWPDLTNSSITQPFWIKTSSAAQGANLVLRKMDATLNSFVQVETPILASDSAANTFYSTDIAGSNGQIYAKPVIIGSGSEINGFEFRIASGATGPWAAINTIIGSSTVPTQGPVNGQMWFNSLLGLDSAGKSTIDIMINDGQDHWININLPGFTGLATSGDPTLYPQSQDPRSNVPAPTLVSGDIWVETDSTPYPVIKKWNGTTWVLVNNTDQTTPFGIIFADARPNPLYHHGSYSGQNNSGSTAPDLDPDAPQAALYPKGFMLWNTRYSTNNVKQWQSPYVFDGVTASADDTNNGSTGRWVDLSGNDPTGVPYMGAAAQHIVAADAVRAVINANQDIRAEDLFFNLIAAPGYIEAISEMLALNDDRLDTSFVVADSPFTLNSSGTTIQNWATNHSNTFDNNNTGLISASKYLGVWYPSGLTTNVDGTDVVVPPSHMALRTIAFNDQVAYPWFAPAGLNRGVINNASSVGYVNTTGQYVPVTLNQGQRDVLYTNGINPIRTMPNGGIVAFGQKTRQAFSSATDRINVVRLENYLRYNLNILAQPFLFEPNDQTTRKAVKAAFDAFLSQIITLRGITDFLVVVDSSNNTPARIDANELWIDIAIIPDRAVEFIYIPIRIKNTGASLTA